METTNITNYEPDALGRLESQCWCDRSTVMVPVELVRKGQTISCGTKKCDEIAFSKLVKVNMG